MEVHHRHSRRRDLLTHEREPVRENPENRWMVLNAPSTTPAQPMIKGPVAHISNWSHHGGANKMGLSTALVPWREDIVGREMFPVSPHHLLAHPKFFLIAGLSMLGGVYALQVGVSVEYDSTLS